MASNKDMYLELAKNALLNVAIVVACAVLVLLLIRYAFGVKIEVGGVSLILGIIGTSLAFFGNSLSTDALGRWGSIGLPQWKWGNRMQAIGFALTILALLVK